MDLVVAGTWMLSGIVNSDVCAAVELLLRTAAETRCTISISTPVVSCTIYNTSTAARPTNLLFMSTSSKHSRSLGMHQHHQRAAVSVLVRSLAVRFTVLFLHTVNSVVILE